MQRQHFTSKANLTEYDVLFRDMSPVPTVYWCCPGEPPSMHFRASFNNSEYNHRRRATRDIIKGRFQNGSIAHIEQKELELYSALYRKPLTMPTKIQRELTELLEREGPMNIQLMKELTGLLVKEIAPCLHKLQEAFVVFEDQTDNEWDRGWYLFSSEFPDAKLDKYERLEALEIVLLRFAKLNVTFSCENAKSFYKLPAKEINAAINELVNGGDLVTCSGGFMLRTDSELLASTNLDMPHSVFILHRNDYMVKSNEHWLKEKFRHDEFDVLQYILIDGEFKGAVIGKSKNGPFVLEDIVLELPEDEIASRKDEIMEAVYMVNSRDHSPIKNYNANAVLLGIDR